MLSFLLSRLAQLAVSLLLTSLVVFASIYLAPGSALSFLSAGRSLPLQTIIVIESQYHLDRPIQDRYLLWLSDVLHGHLGTSLVYRLDVSSLLASRAESTLLLVTMAAIATVLIGVLFGTVSAMSGRWIDNLILLGSVIGLATPGFAAAIVLITIFAVNLQWFPVFGSGTGPLDQIYHLLLPATALAISSTAYVTRVSRAAVKDQMGKEFVETATARGLPRNVVIRNHILRNAMIPISTVAGLTVAGLIAGTVVIEQAFGVSGLGSLLVSSIQQKDFPVVQAISLLLVGAFVVVNTVVDLLYSILDPRIEVGRQQP